MPSDTYPDTDPHFSALWFELLGRTALPEGADIEYAPIGPEDTPDSILLPLVRMPGTRLISGLATCYTPLFAPIGSGNIPEAALTRKFRQIRQRCDITQLRLSPLDTNAAFFSLAQRSLKRAGWIVSDYFCFGNWYGTVDGIFDDWWAARPSRLRNTVKRARKRLEADPDFKIAIIEGGIALDEAINAFVSVYNRSWKTPEPWPDFIPGLIRLAADKGWLRLGLVSLDGKPVASQLWLVANGCAYIEKLAHDVDYDSRGVGTVLSAHLMRHVIEHDHITRIDYLIGDDAYKRDWTPERCERRGLIAFNPRTIPGWIAAARHFGGQRLKSLLKPHPGTASARVPRIMDVFRANNLQNDQCFATPCFAQGDGNRHIAGKKVLKSAIARIMDMSRATMLHFIRSRNLRTGDGNDKKL